MKSETFVNYITSQPGPHGHKDRKAFYRAWIREQLGQPENPQEEAKLLAARLADTVANLERGSFGQGDLTVIQQVSDFLTALAGENADVQPRDDNMPSESRRHRSEHHLVMERIAPRRR
jgi:hypothetical protein